MRRTTSLALVRTGILALALCAGGLAGCEGTTKTGESYTLKANRWIEAYVASDLRRAHDAAIAVVRDDFGYTLESQAVDARDGKVRAKTARGYDVRIDSYRDGDRITRVEIYVGPLGDEPAMREILSALQARLKRR